MKKRDTKAKFPFFVAFALILVAFFIIIFSVAPLAQAATLTCQESCQKLHQRDGACFNLATLDQAKISQLKENGWLIKELNLGKDGCQGEGESCHCQNHRPILESEYPILELEYKYRMHLNQIFAMPSQDTISEYDTKHLICRANIYDQDIKDRQWIIRHPPEFVLLSAPTPYTAFKSLGEISNPNCSLLDTGLITCEGVVSATLAKKIARGMMLRCLVFPKDRYQNGIDPYGEEKDRFQSNILGVADHLYYFFRTQPSWDAAAAQYLFFVDISDITGDLWAIKDRTQRIGKSYFHNKISEIKITSLAGGAGIKITSLRRIAGQAGAQWSRKKDDKLILFSEILLDKFNEYYKNRLKDFPSGGKFGGFAEGYGDDRIFLSLGYFDSSLAHEIGHASINSQLCDEYNKTFWLEKGKCLNPFPACCNTNDDCGKEEWCPGMPYYPDIFTPQPNYKKLTPVSPIWYSVMGQGAIYPIEAQCPLRNCK